jgi:hypothetical protein
MLCLHAKVLLLPRGTCGYAPHEGSFGSKTVIHDWQLSTHSRPLDFGAASRPIAGKRGSHRYNASLGAGDTHVGAGLPAMRPALAQHFGHVAALGRKLSPLLCRVLHSQPT